MLIKAAEMREVVRDGRRTCVQRRGRLSELVTTSPDIAQDALASLDG